MITNITRISGGRNWLGNKKLARVIWDYHNPNNLWRKGYEIHHVDENKLNDDITNLQLMTSAEHRYLHRKGKSRSDETKQKISKSNKGKIHTEKSRKNMSISHVGNKHTEETRLKMSNTRKGKPTNRPGYFPSDEIKEKISVSGKKAWARRKGLC